MKYPIPSCLFLCCLLPAWGFGQSPAADPFASPKAASATAAAETDASVPKTIMLTYETFSLSKSAAADLMMKHRAKDELHTAVLKEYEAKNAVLEHLMVIRTKSGWTAKVEGIDEFPSPTDFESPAMPNTLHLGPMGTDQARAGKAKAQKPPTTTAADQMDASLGQACAAAGPEAIAVAPDVTLNDGLGLITNMVATSFTTRILGQTIELEVILMEDGKTVDVTIAPQFASWIGEIPISTGLTTPVFRAQQCRTTCTIQTGHSMFIGTQSKPLKTGAPNSNVNDSIWLSFLTPRVVAVAMPPKPSPNPSSQLAIRWENISLPKAEAFKLLTAALPDSELHQRLQTMVLAGAARLDSLLSVVARSGQSCKVEQTEELRYAMQFNAPQVPQNLTITDPSILRQLSQEGGAVGRRHPDLNSANLGFGIIAATAGTGYLSRNLGETIELAPILGEDGSTIDVTFAPEIVHQVGGLTYGEIKQPVFEIQKLTTSGTLTKGQPYCFGTMSKPWQSGVIGSNSEDRVWLQFVTAEEP